MRRHKQQVPNIMLVNVTCHIPHLHPPHKKSGGQTTSRKQYHACNDMRGQYFVCQEFMSIFFRTCYLITTFLLSYASFIWLLFLIGTYLWLVRGEDCRTATWKTHAHKRFELRLQILVVTPQYTPPWTQLGRPIRSVNKHALPITITT